MNMKYSPHQHLSYGEADSRSSASYESNLSSINKEQASV